MYSYFLRKQTEKYCKHSKNVKKYCWKSSFRKMFSYNLNQNTNVYNQLDKFEFCNKLIINWFFLFIIQVKKLYRLYIVQFFICNELKFGTTLNKLFQIFLITLNKYKNIVGFLCSLFNFFFFIYNGCCCHLYFETLIIKIIESNIDSTVVIISNLSCKGNYFNCP